MAGDAEANEGGQECADSALYSAECSRRLLLSLACLQSACSTGVLFGFSGMACDAFSPGGVSSACHGTYISRTYSSGRGPAGEGRVQRALCRCRGRGAAGSGWCVHRADASLLPHLHLCLHLPFFRVPRVRAHRGPLWRPPACQSRRDRPCCARPPRLVAKQFQDA